VPDATLGDLVVKKIFRLQLEAQDRDEAEAEDA